MQFTIEHAPVFSTLRVQLQQGEQFRAEAGAMLAMSPTNSLEAKSTGKGLFGTLKAAVGGESFFASLFTANDGEGEVILAPGTPGDILRLDLNGETVFAQGGAYLAGAPDLEISSQGSIKALVSGEGLFLSKITGTGPLFLNAFGSIIEKSLAPGEIYIVDSGHMVAFQSSVSYDVKKASRGVFSSLASGEGLVNHFRGPGTLWMQTRNLSPFAEMLGKFIMKT